MKLCMLVIYNFIKLIDSPKIRFCNLSLLFRNNIENNFTFNIFIFKVIEKKDFLDIKKKREENYFN